MDTTTPPPPAVITFDQFEAIDLRVGLITEAVRVPKKDRLLKLTVNLGEAEPRTIVAGIGESYEPQVLAGTFAVFLVNLAPRDFGKGLVSHGMILATGPDPKHLCILAPRRDSVVDPIQAGARIG